MSQFGFDIDEEKQHYFAGIRLFNEAEFFAAHDAWEEVWHQVQHPRREQFYRAIIKGAVSLVLLQSGRAIGARQVFVDCVKEFEGLPDTFMGLNIPQHIERLRHAIQPAIDNLESSRVVIDPARLFRIELLYDPFDSAPNGEGTC